MFELNKTSLHQQNWAASYLEWAKYHLKNAKGFWKHGRNESYIKLLHTTYHPFRMASKFFKTIGRIIKGILLLIYATFNSP